MRLIPFLILFFLSSAAFANAKMPFKDSMIISISDRDRLAVIKYKNEQVVLKKGSATRHGYIVKDIGSKRITLESDAHIIFLSNSKDSQSYQILTKELPLGSKTYSSIDIRPAEKDYSSLKSTKPNSILYSRPRGEIK